MYLIQEIYMHTLIKWLSRLSLNVINETKQIAYHEKCLIFIIIKGQALV